MDTESSLFEVSVEIDRDEAWLVLPSTDLSHDHQVVDLLHLPWISLNFEGHPFTGFHCRRLNMQAGLVDEGTALVASCQGEKFTQLGS